MGFLTAVSKVGGQLVHQHLQKKKHQKDLMNWKETCAAMEAEEERARYHNTPHGATLIGYWFLEALAICEVPLRMAWHCEMSICVGLTMGPCAMCAEVCAEGKAQEAAHQQQEASARDAAARGNAYTINSDGERVPVQAPPSSGNETDPTGAPRAQKMDRPGRVPEGGLKSPCATVVAGVVTRHCHQIQYLCWFGRELCHNMFCKCDKPYYFFAKDVSLRRPPEPLSPMDARSAVGGNGCCCCCFNSCFKYTAGDDCKDCNCMEACLVLMNRKARSMVCVFGGLESCQPAVCLGPFPCFESEHAIMERWLAEFQDDIEARTEAFYARKTAEPDRYMFVLEPSGKVTAIIQEQDEEQRLPWQRSNRDNAGSRKNGGDRGKTGNEGPAVEEVYAIDEAGEVSKLLRDENATKDR